ncbi:deferrochelatase/peroxidase EfeB [Frigoribacterium sp. CFBP 13729]|uniref:iron uptake transporter deferrochelatase/peroxidase subunit n=1 Tax=Frigoribacterium sp. CFBP 13729 TaxID=2775293 RepID=UPI00177E69BF|nr:iron uptake transporter deferrochelatase/peroxidase subunit [Frigoribacterium sp. CFBP 13729]MBD8610598.1 deferrochelatase/peroxidase EfeB [Frigoribacterium sp. CFBP 13729]
MTDEEARRATSETAAAGEPTGPGGASRGLSRRGLLGLIGTGVGAGALGVGVGVGSDRALQAHAQGTSGAAARYPFAGRHQSGITTAAQDRLHFASFDMAAGTTRRDLVELLQDWSAAAARLTQGLDVSETGATGGSPLAPPDDTGEATGLPAAGLTVTIGFGPTLFTDATGADRYGISSQRPAVLVDLPHFSGDQLEEALTGGDLCVQACSDDPQVAVHAVRNLSRIAFGRASLRWSQLGFGRTSSTTRGQSTPRNLFGFKDGTANVRAEDGAAVEQGVWAAGSDGADWMDGGSYLVARKIRMTIETWDHASLTEQQTVVGRDKGEGAPLSGGSEFTAPDFSAVSADGSGPAIAVDSHVALAHPDQNDGATLLRRGYNFVDGNDSLGRLDAGLFFIAFQRDPRRQFVPIQTALARDDRMNEYLKHVGSGIFAVPPGASQGGWVGETLLG